MDIDNGKVSKSAMERFGREWCRGMHNEMARTTKVVVKVATKEDAEAAHVGQRVIWGRHDYYIAI